MYDEALGVTRVDRHLAMSPRGTLIVVDDLAAERPRALVLAAPERQPLGQPRRRGRRDAGRARLPAGLGPGGGRAHDSHRRRTLVQANPTASTPSLAIERTLHTLSA